jgi:hypothetical protein
VDQKAEITFALEEFPLELPTFSSHRKSCPVAKTREGAFCSACRSGDLSSTAAVYSANCLTDSWKLEFGGLVLANGARFHKRFLDRGTNVDTGNWFRQPGSTNGYSIFFSLDYVAACPSYPATGADVRDSGPASCR